MPDVWFDICAAIDALFPVSWLFLWVLACGIAPHLLDFMQVVVSVVKASAAFAASTFVLLQSMDWDSIALQVSDAAMQVVRVVLAHHQEVLAPLLWLILLMATFWVKDLPPLPASDEGPPAFFPCNQRRATKKAHARQHCQPLAQRNVMSIRSAGLHCSYPLCLRSQSHFLLSSGPNSQPSRSLSSTC
jgi:hypothetical protein